MRANAFWTFVEHQFDVLHHSMGLVYDLFWAIQLNSVTRVSNRVLSMSLVTFHPTSSWIFYTITMFNQFVTDQIWSEAQMHLKFSHITKNTYYNKSFNKGLIWLLNTAVLKMSCFFLFAFFDFTVHKIKPEDNLRCDLKTQSKCFSFKHMKWLWRILI